MESARLVAAEYTNITDVVEIDADNASDMERFTLGVAYRFGHVEEPMAPMAAAAPVAVAAAAPSKCADADNDGVCDTADRCATPLLAIASVRTAAPAT